MTMLHLYPDDFLNCDQTCQDNFSRQYIRGHIEVCCSQDLCLFCREQGLPWILGATSVTAQG